MSDFSKFLICAEVVWTINAVSGWVLVGLMSLFVFLGLFGSGLKEKNKNV